MNINSPFSKLCVVLTAGVLLFAAFGCLFLVNIGSEPESFSETPLEETPAENNLNTPPATGTRAGSPRTVLAELFTNWDCPPCAYANPAINELCDVYGTSQLVMIAYHTVWPGPADPYNVFNPLEVDTRVTYYSVTGVPSIFFDGPPNEGFEPSTQDSYISYKAAIESELATTSPVNITLEGYLNMMTMNGYVNVSVEATDTLPMGTLVVRTAVTEDNGYAEGTNGEVRHRNIFRDMLADESLPGLLIGESHSFTRSFAIDMEYNIENLQVVVFLQNDADQDVLQAAMHDFIPQRVLVVDDDQSTNPDGWEDSYQEVMTFMGFGFDSHVYNEVGSPSSTLLDDYEVVLWLTSDTSSNTLTVADQAAISSYLDGGLGSLFMCGQNIGSDIGATPFYQNYLHSTFVTADTNENTIEGVTGDPISDPFVGGNLQISADSPSEIAPIAPASTTFVYLPSGDPAAVRAEHDVDSRVVYLACMYFEHTDLIDNKAMVMSQVLFWLSDLQHRIALSPGMNLISIPIEQFDTSIDRVLDSISGQYDAVSFYNASQDHWKHDHSSKPVSMNDLTDINHHMGFWIHVITPGDTVFIYEGPPPWQSQVIHLYQGWNLAGYPSQSNHDRTTGLNNLVHGTDVDSVWTYDAASQQWATLGPSDNFELGKGYWIYSLAEQDWTVPL